MMMWALLASESNNRMVIVQLLEEGVWFDFLLLRETVINI